MFLVKGPPLAVNVTQTLAALEKAGKGDRIPVLGANEEPLYVVHRSILDGFISSRATANPPVQLGALTLQDMLSDQTYKEILDGSLATVNETATLADAKAAMDVLKHCQDVFITKAGTNTEPTPSQ